MLLVVALAACSNSGLGQPTQVGTGDTAAGTTALADCPWVGTWALTTVNCNTFPYAPWYDAHDSASMQITQDPAGGCSVVTTVTGPSCSRTEGWHFSVPVGTSVEVTFNGIQTCNPDQCTFDVGDQACSVGGLTGGPVTLSIDDAAGDLAAVGLLEDTAACTPLDVVTRWALQP